MNEMVYININEASKIVSNKSVSEQLRNFDCDLIRRYKGCLCAMVQAFRSAGFSDMDIIMGFRSIGVELSPKYIRMNSFAHINMDKAIISYFRCGYSVRNISRKFNCSIEYVQRVIVLDEELRENENSAWVKAHTLSCV